MKKNSYIKGIFLSKYFFPISMKIAFLKLKLFTKIIIPLVITAGILSCQHQPENLAVFPQVCFQSQILPIFQNSCAISGCHNGGNESGYDFSTYDGILSSVVPGDPLKSPSYKAITALWGELAMPPQQPISEENRTLIRLWIEQGATNVDCSTQGNSGNLDSGYYNARSCFQRDVLPIIQTNCDIPGCHDGTSREDDAQLLTDYSTIRKAVVPGSPNTSRLYRAVTSGGENHMPPSPQSPLTPAQIDTIYQWIQYGALNENCGSICDSSQAITYSGSIWPVIETYCYGCHSGANAQKGLHLENYSEISSVASSGKLMGVLTGQAGYVLMPPAGALSSCEISTINKWVNAGSPNNRVIQ